MTAGADCFKNKFHNSRVMTHEEISTKKKHIVHIVIHFAPQISLFIFHISRFSVCLSFESACVIEFLYDILEIIH